MHPYEKRQNSLNRMNKIIPDYVGSKIVHSPFSGTSVVIHNDGSSFIMSHSSIMEDPKDSDFLWLITEHCGCHLFYKEDLKMYQHKPYRWIEEQEEAEGHSLPSND
jgi:hypothetical protein